MTEVHNLCTSFTAITLHREGVAFFEGMHIQPHKNLKDDQSLFHTKVNC